MGGFGRLLLTAPLGLAGQAAHQLVEHQERCIGQSSLQRQSGRRQQSVPAWRYRLGKMLSAPV